MKRMMLAIATAAAVLTTAPLLAGTARADSIGTLVGGHFSFAPVRDGYFTASLTHLLTALGSTSR